MARLKFGALVTDIRGKIGGSCIQRNGYGHTFKNNASQSYSNSLKQGSARSLLAQVTNIWSRESDAVRGSWDSFANTYPMPIKNNPALFMSGYSYYVKYNIYSFISGRGFQSSAIPSDEIFSPMNSFITLSGGVLHFNPNPESEHPNIGINVSLCPMRSDANKSNFSNMRFLFSGQQETVNMDITNIYQSTFGHLPAIGDSIAVKINSFGITFSRFNEQSVFIIPVTA